MSEATLIEGSRHTVRITRPSIPDELRSTMRMSPTSTAIVLARPSPPPPPPPPPQAPFWCKLDRRLAMLAEPDSARATAFRLLRDDILARGLPRVLAITSPGPNEGKTTCASNLAFALAEAGAARKMLLLDANFFAPTLASMFSIDEYAPAWLAPMRLTALMPNLDVATTALVRGEPYPRIDRTCLMRLLGAFFQMGYEHVIIDAPALDGSPAVAQLLDLATGVLFTARTGRTTKGALRRARDQVASQKQLGLALVDG